MNHLLNKGILPLPFVSIVYALFIVSVEVTRGVDISRLLMALFTLSVVSFSTIVAFRSTQKSQLVVCQFMTAALAALSLVSVFASFVAASALETKSYAFVYSNAAWTVMLFSLWLLLRERKIKILKQCYPSAHSRVSRTFANNNRRNVSADFSQ